MIILALGKKLRQEDYVLPGYIVRPFFKKRKKVVFPPKYAEFSLGVRKHRGRQEVMVAEAPGKAKGEAQEDPGSQWQGLKGCSCTTHAQSDAAEGSLLPPHFL